ncbi:MAG TPA: hypothetical protein VER96_29070 [Polyangiaceae bacterium]|nr:hypothetical protein [Polyangiaceae bacterium]
MTPVVAVAAGRGIPRDPSPELRCDLDRHASHEREFGPGELGGYTHATWDELAEHTAEVSELDEGDWAVVFDIGKRLASDYRFGGKGVRIVVWYNW